MEEGELVIRKYVIYNHSLCSPASVVNIINNDLAVLNGGQQHTKRTTAVITTTITIIATIK